MADKRLDEVVAMIARLSDDPRVNNLEPSNELATVLQLLCLWPQTDNADEDGLWVVGKEWPDSTDIARASKDVAAVICAYRQAMDDASHKVCEADVRAVLLDLERKLAAVGDAVRAVRALGTGNDVVHHVRLRLEEAAWEARARHLLPPRPNRFTPADPRARLADLHHACRYRRGADLARRAAGRRGNVTFAEVAEETGLAARVELMREATAIDTALVDAEVGDWIGCDLDTVNLLREAAGLAASDLASDESAGALIGPPPGRVLAWGAVELMRAWMPNKPPSGDLNNPMRNLIAAMHRLGAPDEPERAYLDAIIEAVAFHKSGQAAVTFSGRVWDPVTTRHDRLLKIYGDDPRRSGGDESEDD